MFTLLNDVEKDVAKSKWLQNPDEVAVVASPQAD
jgi:hypothetical protein